MGRNRTCVATAELWWTKAMCRRCCKPDAGSSLY